MFLRTFHRWNGLVFIVDVFPNWRVISKVGNISFDGYIDTCILWIYRIYQRYIGGYFFMNIDISKINKNTLKFIKILYKSVKMTLIIKYIHCNEFLKSK